MFLYSYNQSGQGYTDKIFYTYYFKLSLRLFLLLEIKAPVLHFITHLARFRQLFVYLEYTFTEIG